MQTWKSFDVNDRMKARHREKSHTHNLLFQLIFSALHSDNCLPVLCWPAQQTPKIEKNLEILPWMDLCDWAEAWSGGDWVSIRIGSGFTVGGGSVTKKLLVDDTVVAAAGAATVAVLLAALITDLKLKMLLRPLVVVFGVLGFVPDALERLALSWFELDATALLPRIVSMPEPPITTAAAVPINDDPINPVAVVGLSEHGWFSFGCMRRIQNVFLQELCVWFFFVFWQTHFELDEREERAARAIKWSPIRK